MTWEIDQVKTTAQIKRIVTPACSEKLPSVLKLKVWLSDVRFCVLALFGFTGETDIDAW